MANVIPVDLCNGALNEVYLTLIDGGRINNSGDVVEDPNFNKYLEENNLEKLVKFVKGFPGSYDHNGIYVHTTSQLDSNVVDYVDNVAIANVVVELIIRDALAEKYLWKYQDALMNFLMMYEFGVANVSLAATTFSKMAGDNGNYCTIQMCFVQRPLSDYDDN